MNHRLVREGNPKVQTITIKQESVLGTRPCSYPINVFSFSWGHMRRQCLQMSADIVPYILVCLGHTVSVSCWTDECHMGLEMCLLFYCFLCNCCFLDKNLSRLNEIEKELLNSERDTQD